MAVYIDNARIPYRRFLMCHMIADTAAELHTMALSVGLRREWYQISRSGVPHYDICLQNKEKAIDRGAVNVLTQRRFGMHLRFLKERMELYPDFRKQWYIGIVNDAEAPDVQEKVPILR